MSTNRYANSMLVQLLVEKRPFAPGFENVHGEQMMGAVLRYLSGNYTPSLHCQRPMLPGVFPRLGIDRL